MKRAAVALLALLISFAASANEVVLGVIGGVQTQQLPFSVFPAANGAQLRTWQEPKQWFVDDFGTGTLNTTNKWQSPTTGGGGNATAATNAVGSTVLGSGNQASGFSLLQTQLVFPDRNPGYLFFQSNINLPLPGTVNSYLMFGFFSVPTTPTTTAPCTNGVGFGFNTSGKLEAISCASGTKTVIADLSLAQGPSPVQQSPGVWTSGCSCVPQQQDTASYKYLIDFRGDNVNWYVEQGDGLIRRVAYITRGSAGPDVNQVPVTYLAIAGTTPPTNSSTIQVNQATVADTAGNPVSKPPIVLSGTGGVLKASPGQLIFVQVTNASAAAFLLLTNSTTQQTVTSTIGTASGNTVMCIPVAISPGAASQSFIPGPYMAFNVGVSVTLATTCTGAITTATGVITAMVE